MKETILSIDVIDMIKDPQLGGIVIPYEKLYLDLFEYGISMVLERTSKRPDKLYCLASNGFVLEVLSILHREGDMLPDVLFLGKINIEFILATNLSGRQCVLTDRYGIKKDNEHCSAYLFNYLTQ